MKIIDNVLPSVFFDRPVLEVAESLIGKYLVRSTKDGPIVLMINDVEAYDGPHDLACHASKGKTPRTSVLFGPAGHLYVYFCYGLHWLLNIVTGPLDYPAAVLIRGAGHVKGPARLTKFLHINSSFNTKKAHLETGLWFEDRGVVIQKKDIHVGPRIGVDYAGPVWSAKPYRFWVDT